MQARPKVLFISSWYPTSLKPTEGNFVQQHLCAAQIIADVALVHVVLSTSHQETTHETRQVPYEEHVVYIPKNERFIIGLFVNYFKIFKTYWNLATQTQIGKPDLIHANVLYPIGAFHCFSPNTGLATMNTPNRNQVAGSGSFCAGLPNVPI